MKLWWKRMSPSKQLTCSKVSAIDCLQDNNNSKHANKFIRDCKKRWNEIIIKWYQSYEIRISRMKFDRKGLHFHNVYVVHIVRSLLQGLLTGLVTISPTLLSQGLWSPAASCRSPGRLCYVNSVRLRCKFSLLFTGIQKTIASKCFCKYLFNMET